VIHPKKISPAPGSVYLNSASFLFITDLTQILSLIPKYLYSPSIIKILLSIDKIKHLSSERCLFPLNFRT